MADCKNALVESDGRHGEGRRGDPQEGDRQGGLSRRAHRGRGRGRDVGRRPTARRASSSRSTRQTDFVSRGDDFKGFVRAVVEVASKAPKGSDLGAHKCPGTDKTVDVVRAELVAKTGENIVVRRWAALEAKEANGFVHAYVHAGGKLAVLVHAEAPKGPEATRLRGQRGDADRGDEPDGRWQGPGHARSRSTSRRRSSRRSSRKRASPRRRGRRSSTARSPSGSPR